MWLVVVVAVTVVVVIAVVVSTRRAGRERADSKCPVRGGSEGRPIPSLFLCLSLCSFSAERR